MGAKHYRQKNKNKNKRKNLIYRLQENSPPHPWRKQQLPTLCPHHLSYFLVALKSVFPSGFLPAYSGGCVQPFPWDHARLKTHAGAGLFILLPVVFASQVFPSFFEGSAAGLSRFPEFP
ncbi:MAG: hypothetical protein M0Z75_18080 [Nitrospiraceae bacterium]|nr:hypothetical protein [Nitrospiraceae bacterium]